MNSTNPTNATIASHWQQLNWRYLQTAIALVRQRLEHHSAQVHDQSAVSAAGVNQAQLQVIAAEMTEPPALEQLCTTFGLSSFERDLLLLCAGMEFDPTLASPGANAQGNRLESPTFDLALAALPNAHWSALTPNSPLRRWRLIEIGAGQTLTLSPLRIDERVLHYLAGVPCSDERILGIIQPIAASESLLPSHQRLAEQLAEIWLQTQTAAVAPIVQLCGMEAASKQAIAAAACSLIGWKLYTISALAVPTHPNDLNLLSVLWKREAFFQPSVLLLECDGLESLSAVRQEAVSQLIEQIRSPLLLTRYDRLPQQQRPTIVLNVYPPTSDEQRQLWQLSLGAVTSELNGQVETLVAQFTLDAPKIQAVCTEAIGKWEVEKTLNPQSSMLKTLLWDSCRTQVRPRLDELAQRIEPSADWDDLILPDKEKQILQSIAAQVRQRTHVYEHWGFRSKSDRGLGISALFAGMSGTGKTLSAEVLAQELRLDLYRIDLSSVVSKYIGETEKNLQRIFDAAEAGAVILLFDEADALFGKRSDVKDSHDRYANMEVSYLLQRMEAYQGLAVLTTNLKDSLDTAFLRRLRFVVKFPFPDVAQRAEIWHRVFPKQTPTKDLELHKLAKLNVAGGNIRNIALNATFLAAEVGEPVQMKHLLIAAQGEYMKLERTLTDAEVKGWVT